MKKYFALRTAFVLVALITSFAGYSQLWQQWYKSKADSIKMDSIRNQRNSGGGG